MASCGIFAYKLPVPVSKRRVEFRHSDCFSVIQHPLFLNATVISLMTFVVWWLGKKGSRLTVEDAFAEEVCAAVGSHWNRNPSPCNPDSVSWLQLLRWHPPQHHPHPLVDFDV